MNIIIDNLEPDIIKKLQNRANNHGRTLTEKIKFILVAEAEKGVIEAHYNAWEKLVTPQSITEAIEGMRQLQKTVALDKSTIREMREKGRRF